MRSPYGTLFLDAYLEQQRPTAGRGVRARCDSSSANGRLRTASLVLALGPCLEAGGILRTRGRCPPETKRAPMFHPRALFRTLAPMLALMLLLAGCVPPPDEPPVVEPAPEPTPENLPAVVNQNANVRTGPGTDFAVAYWLTAGDTVTVVGLNAAGDWLQIEHEDRPGWIFAALTDIAAEGVAEQPAPEPAPEPVAADPIPEPEPMVELTPELTPETVAPAPEPALQTSTSLSVTVAGTVVNLRTGPGTDHPTNGQVRSGDHLQVTGRNAAGDWLQIMHPAATGELVWVYASLTDIDAATTQTLAEVPVDEFEVATPLESEPTPVRGRVAEPQPAAPALQVPQPPAGCTRLHTVNPNEEQLVQITNWFGLDLAATAALNGIAPDAPLTPGWQICLPETGVAPPSTPAPAQPAGTGPAAGGLCRMHTGQEVPCPNIPDFPERAVKSVEGVPVLYHAPGTYDRSKHPGLAYEWELVLSDDSTMWNWTVRDFQGCYDALRVHMGEVPEEIGLTRLEVRLSDPVYPLSPGGFPSIYSVHHDWKTVEDFMGRYFSHGMPETDDPTAPKAQDYAYVDSACFGDQEKWPEPEVFCRIFPTEGNSGSIHLESAVIQSIADTAARMSTRAVYWQYAWNNPLRIYYNSFLIPIIDDFLIPTIDDWRDFPAGPGPCMEVTRAG